MRFIFFIAERAKATQSAQSLCELFARSALNKKFILIFFISVFSFFHATPTILSH
jgi:hypothetical protein